MVTEETSNALFKINDWMPLIVGLILTILAYYQTRKQSSREFVAKERTEWLKETRKRYTLFLELISRIFNMVRAHENNSDTDKIILEEKIYEVYFQIYEHGAYLTMMFNPNDKKIIEHIEDFIKLTKNYVEEPDKERQEKLISEMSKNINRMNGMMRNYFKNEWDQIKSDISYKKKMLERIKTFLRF